MVQNTIALTRIAFISPIITFGATSCLWLRMWMFVHSSWLEAIHHYCPIAWKILMRDYDAMNLARLGMINILRNAFTRQDLNFSRAITTSIRCNQHEIALVLIKEKLIGTIDILRKNGLYLIYENTLRTIPNEFRIINGFDIQFLPNLVHYIVRFGDLACMKEMINFGYTSRTSCGLLIINRKDIGMQLAKLSQTREKQLTSGDILESYRNQHWHSILVIVSLINYDEKQRWISFSHSLFWFLTEHMTDIDFYESTMIYLIRNEFPIESDFLQMLLTKNTNSRFSYKYTFTREQINEIYDEIFDKIMTTDERNKLLVMRFFGKETYDLIYKP
jgi:hypothetical protein